MEKVLNMFKNFMQSFWLKYSGPVTRLLHNCRTTFVHNCRTTFVHVVNLLPQNFGDFTNQQFLTLV